MRHLILLVLLASGVLHAPMSLAHDHPGPADVAKGKYGFLLLTKQSPSSHKPFRHHAFGYLRYEREAPTFNFQLQARGLQRKQDYTLIYFPDPWPGDQLQCIASGKTNRGGALHLRDHVNLNTSLPAPFDDNYPAGARLRLVLSADVDCEMRRMLTWSPHAYLFEKWLIKYTDTDIIADYSGNWCLRRDDEGGTSLLSMTLEQSDDEFTAVIEGFIFTGTLSDHTLVLTGLGPDDLIYTVELTFADDGETLTGSIIADTMVFLVTGSRGQCYDYEEPVSDPECILPVQDPSLVVGGQQFNSVSYDVVHTGLDFKFDSPLPTIVAPCRGILIGLSRHRITGNNIIFSLDFRINAEWSYLIAFEPYSTDTDIADLQEAEIDIKVGDVLNPGDVIGRLIVPPTEFPHIHWGLSRRVGGESIPVCPQDYMTPAAAAELNELYVVQLGLNPVCIPPE